MFHAFLAFSLLASAGPLSASRSGAGAGLQVTVPDLVGDPLVALDGDLVCPEAKTKVEEAGLVLEVIVPPGRARDPSCPSDDQYVVVTQEPEPGTKMSPGGVVTVVVQLSQQQSISLALASINSTLVACTVIVTAELLALLYLIAKILRAIEQAGSQSPPTP